MPRHLRTGRLAILCMLVIGCMVAAAAPAGATAATGHARVPVKIEMLAQLTGPDTSAGTFTSRIGRVKDTGTYTETFTIEILPPEAPTITTEALSGGTVGEFYCCGNLFASGGVQPYTWSVVAGVLPPGLTLPRREGDRGASDREE